LKNKFKDFLKRLLYIKRKLGLYFLAQPDFKCSVFCQELATKGSVSWRQQQRRCVPKLGGQQLSSIMLPDEKHSGKTIRH
jgi:hypothetical protein